MNMLNSKGRIYGLFSAEEDELFQNVNMDNLEVYLVGEWKQAFNLDVSHAYRLKLKEGEWYTTEVTTRQMTSIKDKLISWAPNINDGVNCNGAHSNIEMFKLFRPATQAEIDSVKPCFNGGDVVVVQWVGNETINRLGEEISDKIISYYSMFEKGNIIFDSKGVNFKSVSKATNAQIKQLELEEKKHGKKWNGDGYDDFLIDGKVLNELTESDFENIEYVNHHKKWLPILHNDLTEFIYHMVNIESVDISAYRLKPKESFVDVEIRWGEVVKGDGVMTFCIPPWAETEENISTSPIGQVYRGWCLQSFIHQESSMCSNMPICFGQGSVRHAAEILSKATHARFCKVITNATQY